MHETVANVITVFYSCSTTTTANANEIDLLLIHVVVLNQAHEDGDISHEVTSPLL